MANTLTAEVATELLGQAPLGILMLNASGRVEWVNDTLLTMMQAQRAAVVGKRKGEFDSLELQLLLAEQPTIYIPPLHGRDERWLQCHCHDTRAGDRVHYYHDVTREHHLERERNRLESIVVESTTSDAVTGLLNRRGVIQRLEPQLARCRRYETPLSIVVFTVKMVRDQRISNLGEQCLLELAQLVKDYVRWADMVGHEGNGEFIMVLPETPLAGAADLCERLAKVIEATRLSGLPEAAGLRAYIGLSEWRKNDNLTALLQRTTEALEQASAQGQAVVSL